MTRKEALEKSVELWQWLAEDGSRGKFDHDSPTMATPSPPLSGCYLCDYTKDTYLVVDVIDCSLCPMRERWWGEGGDYLLEHCTDIDSIYDRWEDLDDEKDDDERNFYDIVFFAKLMVENMQEVLDEI